MKELIGMGKFERRGQSSTLMIRGLPKGEIQLRDFWSIMGRELSTGIVILLKM